MNYYEYSEIINEVQNRECINGMEFNHYVKKASELRRSFNNIDLFWMVMRILDDLYMEHFSNDKYIRARDRHKACVMTKKLRNQVLLKHGNKCLKCGTDKKITIDHVIPVSLGGSNDIENMQPLCRSCNSKKSTKQTDYRKKN